MRPAANDLLQGFRFHVTAENADGNNPLYLSRGEGFDSGGEAGFQSVTLPEITTEAVEYREGTYVWTQKYPGPPTVADCTLMRGIAKEDTAFYDWAMGAVNGEQYRANVTIWHYQREEMGQANNADTSGSIRRYNCTECIPIRVKPAADLDSTSGEVSLGEVDFAMEGMTIDFN